MNINNYTKQAETFLKELNEEYFQHGAGLKEELELVTIYDHYRQLFERDMVQSLLQDRDSRIGRYLAHFGVFGFVENELRELTEQIAEAETRATVEWDGVEIPHRKARVLAGGEPDTERRRELERRIVATTALFNPQYSLRLARAHQAATELFFVNYAAMSDQLAALGLERLYQDTQQLLLHTQSTYLTLLTTHLAAAGIRPEEATTADFTFLRRGTKFDRLFPESDLLPALSHTLAGLGIELESQGNIKLDLEDRPLKTPRAFCAPVKVPTDVRLVIRPRGGSDDYLALFHEAGHAEHFAYTCEGTHFAYRCLGDNSVTEAYAFVLGKLPTTAAWLQMVLGQSEFADFLSLARLIDLYYLRRYAAKLAYELKLHSSDNLDGMQNLYSQMLGEALKVQVWPQNFLSDVDDFFYCACYLRAWMLEAQLRRRLVADYGPHWFAKKEAGDFLKELWALGQEFTADELAQRLGYPGLQIEPLIEDLLSVG